MGETIARLVQVLLLALAIGGCTSFSGGDAGTSSGGMTGNAGGTDGGSVVTFSCYVSGEFCSQLQVQPAGVASAQQDCANLQNGASGTGCPTAGLLGCCQPNASDSTHEEQCYYDPAELSAAMSTCQTTWTTTM